MQVWIGTSGYSYGDWVGGFYPPGTRQGKMLDYYVQHFPLVELNFSFYRLPTPAMLARMAEHTPTGFQFLVKVPRTITHDWSPQEFDPFRLAVDELKRRGQLLGLLAQFPQAMHREKRHVNWVERIGREFTGYSTAVEFRHNSWATPGTADWLRQFNLDLVSVDVPDLRGLFPRGLVQSTSTVYVRFHSRHAGHWYESDSNRYDYSFTDEELAEWIEALNGVSADTDRIMLLFNNCKRSQAAANAQRMRELLEKLAPEMSIVAPFASPQPSVKQRLLFD
jgi:uncharacterized protein YecE (DUF72 family)